MSDIHLGDTEYIDNPIKKFWDEVQNKDKNTFEIVMNKDLMLNFLKEKGFRKIYKSKSTSYIRIVDNIIYEVIPNQISDFILNYIRKASTNLSNSFLNEEVESLIINKPSLIHENLFKLLETTELDILRDTKNESFFFFKNCIVKVNAKSIEILKYDQVDKQIWENQIVPHEYNNSNNTSDFQDFVSKICKDEKERCLGLLTVIGYLLHTYKDATQAKAVIFMDEEINEFDAPDGRSGKSLLAKGIGKLRTMVTIDGKTFNFNNSFIYQEVNLDTQIINFNDVIKDFRFESLFSTLTEGINVNKKFQQKFHIPFSDSPKIVITTNYSIQGSGGSFKDRMIEIEFSNCFNEKHSPKDEYEKTFFDEWNQDEWNSFFRFMFTCVRIYFIEGLVIKDTINAEKKKIINLIGKELFDYAEKLIVSQEYVKKDEFEKFRNEVGIIGYSQRTFTNNLREYAYYKKFKMNERQSAGKDYFTFIKTAE